MAGPYELFKTNDELENQGVSLNYGSFKIVIARAGGSNKKYTKIFEAKIRPYRRAIQAGTLDDATDKRVMAEVYADAVVLGWAKIDREKQPDGNYVDKVTNGVIPGPDGQDMPFTKANVIKLFTDLPDLFSDVIQQANSVSLFKDEEEAETDAKN